jgi:hypothetical protein
MRELFAPDDTRDALRKQGGLLLALGVLMLVMRKGDDLSDFVTFLLYGAMAAYLYGAVFTTQYTDGARPWTAVHSVLGLIFVPLALGEFVAMLDGDAGSGLNIFWIFGVTAALAFYAGIVKGIRFHLLAGSITVIASWTGLWDKLLGAEGIAGHFGVYRGLLGILSIILLAGALWLWRRGDETRVTGTVTDDGGDEDVWKASELFTGAGIAAVLGCGLGISSLAAAQFVGPFGAEVTVVRTAQVWDVLLLLVSLGLVGVGSLIGTRGPVYVGALGLILFLLIVGLDLNEDSPQPGDLGLWPILLLLAGGLLIGLSTAKEASLGDRPRRFLAELRDPRP